MDSRFLYEIVMEPSLIHTHALLRAADLSGASAGRFMGVGSPATFSPVLRSVVFMMSIFLLAFYHTLSILCTTIAVAAPPPLQIAATPYSPTFN